MGEWHTTSVNTGASLLSPSGSVQQHGLCSSRAPCTTKAEEEDTSDVIITQWLIAAAAAFAGDSREGEQSSTDKGELQTCLNFSLFML